MPKYQWLASRLYDLRMAVGIATQAELAHQLGISQQTVSRWEAGTSRPRANQLGKLATLLAVDVAKLTIEAGYVPDVMTVSFDRPLPLASLLADSFEYFCLDLLASLYQGKADLHPAGKTGHKQYGIDIEARFANGDLHTYQCKREAQFGPEKVKKAIKAQTVLAKKKHILLSRVASPDARSEIKSKRGWILWDQIDITRQFRTLPKQEQVRIVDVYFPSQRFALTGEMAAGPWQTVNAFFAPQLVEGRIFNHCWELVGRSSELGGLARAFADRSVLAMSLIGRAGEGKSRILRTTLNEFVSKYRGVRVVVASPTEEITAKSLEDLGAGEKLLVADDVHDRNDLLQLIRFAADSRSEARLLLVYRPYWTDVVQRELARYGLTDKLHKSITLDRPTKQDGFILAQQVLAKNGASTEAAEKIAAMAYDSPLAVVVGAQIVANQGVHPELFGSNDDFRRTVLGHYEKVIAQGIAQGKDQERIHAILRVLSLIQPVLPDDRHLLELLASVERVAAPDASRLIRLLVDAGVLFKRGALFRLSPDLLADSIIESTCITASGTSNGYAEQVFAAAIPKHKEHVLLNLGRFDWRRNERDTSASTLLDGLWSQLEWKDDYVNAQVKAAAAAAYFQPRQALVFARRLIDSGHGREEDVCRIIQGATYDSNHLNTACSLLWEVGQLDARPTNRHPNHAIRLLMELATPEPRKPSVFVEGVVDFALSLVDYLESWKGPYTPFDVLKGALATEGHLTFSKTREISISRYIVQHEMVKEARKRIIAELVSSLTNTNQHRAFFAAQHLADALRGPMNPHLDVDKNWGSEFGETLEKIDTVLVAFEIPAPILIAIAESVHWHACYGPVSTKIPARRIISHLDRDLSSRTIRALMDAWGTNTWFADDEATGHQDYENDIQSLCLELGKRYPEPFQLAQFLHERLEHIALATAASDPTVTQSFLHRLLESNLVLARYLVLAHLRGERSHLSPHVGRSLGVWLASAWDEASSLIEKMLVTGDLYLPVVAESYLFAVAIRPQSEPNSAILERIFSSRQGEVIWYALRIGRELARHDKRLALVLLTSIDIENALRHVHDFFMWIVHEDSIPFDSISEDQLRKLIEGLRHLPHLGDYWVNAFLKKAIRRLPQSVLELAMVRIEDAIASDDWEKQPIGGVLPEKDALDLMTLAKGPALFRGLLDWALGRAGEYMFSYRFAALVQSLCSPFNAACVATMEEWFAGGTAEHVKVIVSILRDSDSRFIYNNEGFIARLLKAARSIGIKEHRDLSTAIFAASTSGMRSGTPGQPFEFDVQLKTMAEQRLAHLTKSDPTFELYRSLRDHASRDIKIQLEEGRIMDEMDSDS